MRRFILIASVCTLISACTPEKNAPLENTSTKTLRELYSEGMYMVSSYMPLTGTIEIHTRRVTNTKFTISDCSYIGSYNHEVICDEESNQFIYDFPEYKYLIKNEQLIYAEVDSHAFEGQWANSNTYKADKIYKLNGSEQGREVDITISYDTVTEKSLHSRPLSEAVYCYFTDAICDPLLLPSAFSDETFFGDVTLRQVRERVDQIYYTEIDETVMGFQYSNGQPVSVNNLSDFTSNNGIYLKHFDHNLTPYFINLASGSDGIPGVANIHAGSPGGQLVAQVNWQYYSDYLGKPAIRFNADSLPDQSIVPDALIQFDMSTLIIGAGADQSRQVFAIDMNTKNQFESVLRNTSWSLY